MTGIEVLHVDDRDDFVDMAALYLEREDDQLSVTTATSAAEGLELVLNSDTEFDCIVSDYEMPGMDGIAFLARVREEHPELPFILFTGKGSEDVASEAISAGVTDYFQKESGTEQFALLARKVRNAAERYNAEQARRRYLEAIETAQEGIAILDEDGHFVFANDAYADIYGYDRDEIRNAHWTEFYPDDELPFVEDELIPAVEERGHWHGRTRGLRADGTVFPKDHAVSVTSQGDWVCSIREVTDTDAERSDSGRTDELFALVQEAAGIGAWEYDATTRENVWTQKVYDIYEVSEEFEPTPEKGLEFYHPADRDLIRDAFTRALEDGEPYEVEVRLITAEDDIRWVRTAGYPQQEDGEVVAIRGTIQDITDQRDPQQRSHEAQQTLSNS